MVKSSSSTISKHENIKQSSWNYFQLSTTPSHALLHVRSGIHLYSLDQVPTHQQDNKFITDGYRSYLSAKQCLRSVLIRSNELVNIWTHGGMAFALLLLMVYDQTLKLTSMKTNVVDHLVFLTFNLCVQICLICSAGYHTFNCHVQKKVALRWYAVDLYGITVGMMGCYSIGLYYGFYCIRNLRACYTVIIFTMIFVSGVIMLHPQYMTESWRRRRLAHLTTVSVFGLFPTFHWVYAAPRPEMQQFFPKVLIFYLILAFAMTIYLTKFPECIWPGSFNMVGHSHNWWHLLINSAFLYWRSFAFSILQHRITNQCVSVS